MQNNAEFKLSRRQWRVVTALATEPTIAAAARAAGCGERVIYDDLRLPHFQAAVNREIELVRAEARRRKAVLLTKALDVVETNMDGVNGPKLQFDAAKEVLHQGQNEDIEHVLQRVQEIVTAYANA